VDLMPMLKHMNAKNVMIHVVNVLVQLNSNASHVVVIYTYKINNVNQFVTMITTPIQLLTNANLVIVLVIHAQAQLTTIVPHVMRATSYIMDIV